MPPQQRERATKASARSTASGDKGSTRRQELLAIAAETFADLGYSRTRIRDIAERANIHNGSLYHHFPGREAMLDELLTPYFDGLVPMNERIINADLSARDKLYQLVRETVLNAAQYRAEVAILQKDWDYLVSVFPYVSRGIQRTERLWLGLFEEGVESGEFRADVNLKVVYRTYRGAMWGVSQWYRPTGRVKIDEIADVQATVLLAGLVASP
ncbi:TetR/AcrR family transcriptional regulator [Gordonia sp. TBRC 11910]|uniref:TetR/AcrR family transcriptional regulator n=1 Tax=Gordonia asplenii TaxID=2725283 RepID=A0A848L2U8_9ACTN|nr:TetR/AcrR family transcriptional regulator [Gordonia asplenii]NMO02933.1 TetR/AcrR family transcriptional regulator [Gordonia asplenii]